MALFTPVNQRRHTNVAIVRLKRAGKRFELAAYPNKVQSWRNGVEKSLDEVLQSPAIYTNVSQGVYPKKEDLKAAFDTDDTEAIIKIILEKGDIQVSEKERSLMLESLFKDIATVVSEKCVDRTTRRPIPVSVVERAMKDMHYSVNPNRNAKQQALDVIRQLKERMPIERAQMQLKICGPAAASKVLKDKLKPLLSAVEKEETEGKYECVCFIDPGNFRKIEEILKADGKGTATVEVLSLSSFKETTDQKALPSGSGEEADDEDDQQEVAEEAASKKPQPVQRRRGQKMPGEPDSEEGESSDDDKKGKGKKKGRKKKPAAVAVTKPAAKGKAQAKPTHPMPPSDEDEEQEEGLDANMKNLSLKVPALPKRSALTSGSEAEAEDAAKPPVAKGLKAKGKAKGKAPATAFSALLEADDG